MRSEKRLLIRVWEWLGYYARLQTLVGIFAGSSITLRVSSMIPEDWNAPQIWAWSLMWFSGTLILTLLATNGLQWIYQKLRTESSRFGDLTEGLKEALHVVTSYQDGHEHTGSLRKTVRPMRVRLQQFSIPCPEVDEVARQLVVKLWSSFLADIVPLAEQRDLRAARDLFTMTRLDQQRAGAYIQVRNAFKPEILNPNSPGNPHYMKELAKDAVNNLRPKLVALGVQTPSPIDVTNPVSLQEWYEYLSCNNVAV